MSTSGATAELSDPPGESKDFHRPEPVHHGIANHHTKGARHPSQGSSTWSREVALLTMVGWPPPLLTCFTAFLAESIKHCHSPYAPVQGQLSTLWLGQIAPLIALAAAGVNCARSNSPRRCYFLAFASCFQLPASLFLHPGLEVCLYPASGE